MTTYSDIAVRQKLSTRDLSTIILTAGLLTVYFLPTEFLFHNPTSFCIHKNLLHFDCPGCGMTRALYSFLHLDFNTALHLNFGIFALAPLLITEIGLGLKFNRELFKIKKVLYYVLCAARLQKGDDQSTQSHYYRFYLKNILIV